MTPERVIEQRIARLRAEMEREVARMNAAIRAAIDGATLDDRGRIIVTDGRNLEILGRLRDDLLGQYREIFGDFPGRAVEIGRDVVDATGRELRRMRIDSGLTTQGRDFIRAQAGDMLDAIAVIGRDGASDLREVLIGLRQSNTITPTEAFEAFASKLGGVGRAVTLVDTAVAGLDRTMTIDAAEDSGVELFLYDGPVDSLTRPWCRKRVGRVFTSEEIDEDDNDTGPNPPSQYGGGYHCRHRWVPLTARQAKGRRRW